MYIVLVGASGVGIELAKRLLRKKQKVVMIEKTPELARKLEKELDTLVIDGNGASVEDLNKARIKKAHMLIAVTKNDTTNVISCMLAKQMGVSKTIARVMDPDSIGGGHTSNISHKKLGIDYVINPRLAVAGELKDRINYPQATEIDFFAEGKVMLLGTKVSEEAGVLDKSIKELDLPENSIIVGIKRKNGGFEIARGDKKINKDDKVYLAGNRKVMHKAAWYFHREKINIKRILILGGNTVGYKLAKILEANPDDNYIIKIVEKDTERCEYLNRQLTKTLVLENDYLNREEIEDADMLVTVTGDDKTNIIALTLACKKGIRVVSEINDVRLEPIYEALEIENTVNPYVITAAQIIRHTREEEVVSLAIMKDENSECFEINLPKEALATGEKISRLDLPRNTIITALVRGGEMHIPRGDTVLEAGDRLIIFTSVKEEDVMCKFFARC